MWKIRSKFTPDFTTFHHNFWRNSRTGLDFMAGNTSMKTKKKSACIDFRTNLEMSPNRHVQLVDSDERLIYLQCNLCKMEFPSSDKLIEIRKKRHEKWHDGSQSSKHASQNKVWGKVIWKKLHAIKNKKKSGVK